MWQWNMPEVLAKYESCNGFSLSECVNKKSLPKADCERAYERLKAQTKGILWERYAEYRAELSEPPETIYERVRAECERFEREADRSKYPRRFGATLLRMELTRTGRMPEPKGFYETAYSLIGREIDERKSLFSRADSELESFFKVLEREETRVLRENLERYELGGSNGGTTYTGSAASFANFYFRLNDETRAWLLKYENEFEDWGLEDLALYEDGKLRFSTCSHEGFCKEY